MIFSENRFLLFGIMLLAKKKPPGFAGRFFVGGCAGAYSPPPKRRDHQPALRGWSAAAASVSAGDGAGAGCPTAAGVAGAASGCGPDAKLTFSRTVERRRAAFSSAAVSSAVGAGAAPD